LIQISRTLSHQIIADPLKKIFLVFVLLIFQWVLYSITNYVLTICRRSRVNKLDFGHDSDGASFIVDKGKGFMELRQCFLFIINFFNHNTASTVLKLSFIIFVKTSLNERGNEIKHYFMICLFVYTRNYMSCRKIINTHSSVCNYLGTLLPSYRTMVHTYILQVRLD